MSELVSEILLRAAKVVVAIVVGVVLYALITGPLGVAGSAELGLLSFVAGGVTVLLMESSPL
jgi:hypothetical protein